MIEFLLALNVAALVSIAVFFPPHDAAELFHTIVPAWLQGIGTILAVFVGWRALTTWRAEGLVSSKAEQARNLIPDFEELVASIIRVRKPIVGYPEVIQLKFLRRVLSDRRRQAAKDLQKLQTLHWGRRTAIIDAKVSDDMELLLALVDEVLDALGYLEFEYSNYASSEAGDMIIDNDIKPFLNTLGLRPIKERPVDAIETNVQRLAKEIRTRLRSHMAFEDN